jgi:hypothetical protein
MAVRGMDNVGHLGHVLYNDPLRLPFVNDPEQLSKHSQAVTRRLATSRLGEILARRPGDDAVEATGGNVEILDPGVVEGIGAAGNRKAFLREGVSEEVKAGEKAQH